MIGVLSKLGIVDIRDWIEDDLEKKINHELENRFFSPPTSNENIKYVVDWYYVFVRLEESSTTSFSKLDMIGTCTWKDPQPSESELKELNKQVDECCNKYVTDMLAEVKKTNPNDIKPISSTIAVNISEKDWAKTADFYRQGMKHQKFTNTLLRVGLVTCCIGSLIGLCMQRKQYATSLQKLSSSSSSPSIASPK